MSNKGIYSPKDTKFLMDMQQFPRLGQLKLIETQSYSSAVSAIDFLTLGDYDVHFMTLNNIQGTNDQVEFKFYLYEDSVLESSSVYDWARHITTTVGGDTDQYSSTRDGITIFGSNDNDTNHKNNGTITFYNLQNKMKYSHATFQTVGEDYYEEGMHFGSAVLPQASFVNGIRFQVSANNFSSFHVSLYGVEFS